MVVDSDLRIEVMGCRVHLHGSGSRLSAHVSPVDAIRLWVHRRRWKRLVDSVRPLLATFDCRITVRIAGIPCYRVRS